MRVIYWEPLRGLAGGWRGGPPGDPLQPLAGYTVDPSGAGLGRGRLLAPAPFAPILRAPPAAPHLDRNPYCEEGGAEGLPCPAPSTGPPPL